MSVQAVKVKTYPNIWGFFNVQCMLKPLSSAGGPKLPQLLPSTTMLQ
jgi:hypothetical protein